MFEIKCRYDELLDPEILKPHPKNRNSHPQEQIERLVHLFKANDIRSPIVVSKRSGYITKGHGRRLAAIRAGLKEYPVEFQDYKSDEQEYQDVQADNAIALWAELDLSGVNLDLADYGPELDIDALGLKDFVVEPADKYQDKDADEVPEVAQNIHSVKLGQIWKLGEHRLMCGDSTDMATVEKLMNGEKADMVFTDPPYGVGVINTHGSILGDEDLTVFKACLPLLKSYSNHDTHFYVWCASGDMFPQSIAAFSDVFPFQNILPIRCTHENKRGNKGAFKLNFETCLFANDNSRAFNASKKIKVSDTTLKDNRYNGDGNLRVYPALWDGERATEHNMNIVHPTQKKVEMIEFYVEISSNKDSLVLDLFGGSGSTLIACEKTNRKCFMMELDPHYCSVIIERWQKFTGKQAELIAE